VTAADLLAMDEAGYRAWAQGSPAMRPGVDRMARNAAVALGNAGERRHLPVLQEAAEQHPSPTVREAAAWAARRIVDREP
jgi:epoxyqueuosine reductase